MTQLLTPIHPHVTQAIVECHSEGHQWRPDGRVDPSEAEPGMRAPFWATGSVVGRRSTCVSCGAERIRWYTRHGEVVNRYRYQEGYLHKRERGDDDPAPSRQDWRKRLIVTLFDDLELGAPQQAAPVKAAPQTAHPSRRSRRKAAGA